ncbi:hypothetical protein [Aurantimonas endophytica]|uniref:Uncharacterized protein n=1 Tax=Aurantimonas endophytica TaxID=1522175 RepID=A0A7W6MNY4_9HYPH|nr:hypothetical protein [Aurantimonas endophytica]MBB4002360.1 hypothetical protein [Aurantimonas endophytica]MCO6402016.1 hypothetical protein [Aurantimonas endophytica]
MIRASNLVEFRPKITKKEYPVTINEAHEEQYRFFDYDLEPRSVKKIIEAFCIPMQEVHGHTFISLLKKFRSSDVVDFRKYPTFSLISADRHIVLNAMEEGNWRYHNHYVEIGTAHTKSEEWSVVERICRAAERVLCNVDLSKPVVFLVHCDNDRMAVQRTLIQAGCHPMVEWRFAETVSGL